MGTLPLIDVLLPLVPFMALILAASLHGLAVSSHFPRRHRGPGLVSGFGPIILFGSMALVVVCLVPGIAAALRFVPWYAAIIGGGFSLLAAPLVLRWFPDRFVDGRGALVTFAAASAVSPSARWIVVAARCKASGITPPQQSDKTSVWLTEQTISKMPCEMLIRFAAASIYAKRSIGDPALEPSRDRDQRQTSAQPVAGFARCRRLRSSPSAATTRPPCAISPPRPP